MADHAKAADSSPAPLAAESRPRRIHWKTGLIILLVGIAAQLAAWFWIAPDRTYRAMSFFYVAPSTLCALLLWWVFVSGFTWRTRLAGLGVLAAAVGAFFATVRVEGFEGDMKPILAWRWNPTSEDRAAEYRRSSRHAAAPSASLEASAGTDAGQPPHVAADEDDWPHFRGPGRDGVVRNTALVTDWDHHPPDELWRHPVGPAWSSFAVVANHVFTQEQRGTEEAVVCYDLETGSELWAHTDSARFSSTLGGLGPRATPTFYDGRLYTLGATGILNCLDPVSGELHWSTNILEDAGADNVGWGMAGSPLVYDDVVVVNPGGNAETGARGGVAAYDRITGSLQWARGDRPASYCAPRLETIGGVRHLLIFDGAGLFGHDPQTGRTLWGFLWTNDPQVNATQPLVLDEQTIFISSGYAQGAALISVEHTSSGWTAAAAGWERSRDFKAKFNGFVRAGEFVYGFDEGILCCFDLDTGRRRWKRGRYGYGQLLLVGDVLLVLSEHGEVVLVEAAPDAHREQARFQAIEGKTWNHPALVGDRLLVRNDQEAACYRLALDPAAD